MGPNLEVKGSNLNKMAAGTVELNRAETFRALRIIDHWVLGSAGLGLSKFGSESVGP